MSEWKDVRMVETNASRKPVQKKQTPQDLSASIRQANVEYLAKLNASKKAAEKLNASTGSDVFEELMAWNQGGSPEEAAALLKQVQDLFQNDKQGYAQLKELLEGMQKENSSKCNSEKECDNCDGKKQECNGEKEEDDIDLWKDSDEAYGKNPNEWHKEDSKKKELDSSEDAEKPEEKPAEKGSGNELDYTDEEVSQALNSDASPAKDVKYQFKIWNMDSDMTDVDWEDDEFNNFVGQTIDEIASSYGGTADFYGEGDELNVTFHGEGDPDIADFVAYEIEDAFHQSGFYCQDNRFGTSNATNEFLDSFDDDEEFKFDDLDDEDFGDDDDLDFNPTWANEPDDF